MNSLNVRVLDGLRSIDLRAGVEAALVLLLAVQAARLIWAVAAPPGPLGGAVSAIAATPPGEAVDLAILRQFDPFNRTPQAAAGDPGEGSDARSGSLRLFGVRVVQGGAGSAIIRRSDGREASFVVGEEVEPGVVLKAVAADHVILSRGGARQRLGFAPFVLGQSADAGAAALPPPPAPAPAVAGPVLGPEEFLQAAALAPRTEGGRVRGYRVLPRGGGDVLARAGLQAGDVLLSLDGSELNAERVAELRQQFSQGGEFELRFERGGQVMTTRVRMAPQAAGDAQ